MQLILATILATVLNISSSVYIHVALPPIHVAPPHNVLCYVLVLPLLLRQGNHYGLAKLPLAHIRLLVYVQEQQRVHISLLDVCERVPDH